MVSISAKVLIPVATSWVLCSSFGVAQLVGTASCGPPSDGVVAGDDHPGVSRGRVDVAQQPLIPFVQLPDGLGVSFRNPVSNCSSESESECCSSASSGAPVGNALTMEDFRARNRLDIVHEAASLLTNRQEKIPIEIDHLCAFVCSFFGLSAGEVTDAINEWEQLGIMCTGSNATVFFKVNPP